MRFERENFVILSVPWTIKEVPSGSAEIDDCYGKVSWTDYTIYLSSDGPWQERLETLLHEIIHVIARGRDRLDLTKEDELLSFSEVLTDVLIRNQLSFVPDDEHGW